MDIHFLGVGEACDGSEPNTSILLRTGEEQSAGRILLDCGFSVPHRYLAFEPDPEELEFLWISHFHGDHFLGTPLLLLWLWEMGRKRPLTIMGPPEVEVKIKAAMELAYPNLRERLGFPLVFVEMTPGVRKKISDTGWLAAFDEHSQPCLSLRLELCGKAIFYSGDGRPTEETRKLAAGCEVVIHEAYGLEDTIPGHGSITTCVDVARGARSHLLLLVHLQRDVRKNTLRTLENLQEKYTDIVILLPEQGSTITI